jgi:RNA polymerase sigma factor (TIGR02999 family)
VNLIEFYLQKFNRLPKVLTNLKSLRNIAPKSAKTFFVTGSVMNNRSLLSKEEITGMLRAWGTGEEEASEDLIRAVYQELRQQARYQLRRERANHTLRTTALINEAYLKLIEQRSVKWKNRGHFFALAAELMRRILVDHARTRHRQKRGGAVENIALEDVPLTIAIAASDKTEVDLLALDEALKRLAEIDKQQVQIVELRYFSGLNVEETAEVLNISPSTVKRDWVIAKAWLKHELTRGAKV